MIHGLFELSRFIRFTMSHELGGNTVEDVSVTLTLAFYFCLPNFY